MNNKRLEQNDNSSTKRFSWILFDDINRRLSILIEECAHLQEIINYYSEFDITHEEKKSPKENNNQGSASIKQKTPQRNWTAKLKEDKNFSYIKLPPIERSLVALYEHLGGINKGLEAHKDNIRQSFEKLLQNPNDHVTFFWFVSKRGFVLHNILEKEMEHLEHAHEKLIQILETKPGALPNPILLRRWNSALHGRFLSEYSRHIDWETSKLINSLKGKNTTLTDDDLQDVRKKNSFIHSWAHTPTSMEDNFFEKSEDESEPHGFGSIRSSFFYLEMPLIYPLLYHECAHLQFAWEEMRLKSNHTVETGVFFSSRYSAYKAIEYTLHSHNINIKSIENFIEEIWIDTIAIALGGLPFFTALAMQIFSQSSSTLFTSDSKLPIQSWGKEPIFDISYLYNTSDAGYAHEYFWSARLHLAEFSLKNIHPEEYEANIDWVNSVHEGIDRFYQGGATIFAAELTSKRHEVWWKYKEEINRWILLPIKNQLKRSLPKIRNLVRKPLSQKYRLEKEIIDRLVIPPVRNFEKKLFKELGYSIKSEKYNTRIEHIPFSIRWHLSKHVINNITSKNMYGYTKKYADHIRNDGSAIFRLAIECVMARNDLYSAFADYIDNPNIIDIHFKKLKPSNNERIFRKISEGLLQLNGDYKEALVSDLNYHRIYTDSSNWRFLKEPGMPIQTKELIFNIKKFVDSYLKEIILPKLETPNDTEVNIGTMTFGIISKRLLSKSDSDGYFSAAKTIQRLYNEKIKGLNENMPECLETGITYSYERINVNNCNQPFETALYFLSGEYDFLFYQERITPTEAGFHPLATPPLLTKHRVLIEVGRNYHSQERKAWGRVSLLSFRYRWEIYQLKEELEKSNIRYRLWLSSAWEDGILVTWHETNEKFWEEGFEKLGSTTSKISSIDMQTNIILCRLDASGELLYSPCGSRPIVIPPKLQNQNSFIEFIRSMEGETNLLSKFRLMLGRGDYLLRWNAKSPIELVDSILQLPPAFWSHISHLRTTLTRLPPDIESEKDKDRYRPRFTTEVSAKIFPRLIRNKD